ncbi:hypothetical protein J3Q64DRAFT_1139228 [Phycomyces blakesleeanus]|uniref:Uncharacterized protein n=1 Tax=Phycomyces blakesleeanus TaxID=4837 RepID=A0ABR3AWP7_PHYBL
MHVCICVYTLLNERETRLFSTLFFFASFTSFLFTYSGNLFYESFIYLFVCFSYIVYLCPLPFYLFIYLLLYILNQINYYYYWLVGVWLNLVQNANMLLLYFSECVCFFFLTF